MKYYIIAGEASGDLHGSNLMKEIKNLDSDADFRFWGGDLMQKQGGTLIKHYKDISFMGFWEVFKNLRTILKNLAFCEKDILKYQPDILIMIDYPGFNLRMAKTIHQKGIKTAYYVSPQLWAWKKNRVHSIKKYVDKMHVILPFEKDFYKQFDYSVEFVGHPLVDAVNDNSILQKPHPQLDSITNKDSRKIISILPGSRKQEISKMLPAMAEISKHYPEYQFIVAAVSWQTMEFYQSLSKNSELKFVIDETYALLSQSHAAMVTSGTATLETALFKVPQVVCYKSSRISYEIAKRLVKGIKYISLVNLIMDKNVVCELIQNDFNPKRLRKELDKIIDETDCRNQIMHDYNNLEKLLGKGGASAQTAESIFKMTKH
jgi:lipid-A-disaccharide synthase